MNSKDRKIQARLGGLQSVHRKVYDILPENEYWDVIRILIEFKSSGVTPPSHLQVTRAAQDLVKHGLARSQGTQKRPSFQAVVIRTEAPKEPPVANSATKKTPPTSMQTAWTDLEAAMTGVQDLILQQQNDLAIALGEVTRAAEKLVTLSQDAHAATAKLKEALRELDL